MTIQLKEFETKYVERGEYTLEKAKYAFGGTALILTYGPERVATVSVVMPNADPDEGCIWVKTWGENAGIMEELINRGLLELTGRKTPSGFVVAYEARLVGELAK